METVMRVLVTGGAGYIGCLLVPELIRRGHTVRVFDRLCFGEAPLAALALGAKCEIVRGDIRRLDQYPALLQGVQAVVHLAGLANDPSCDLHPHLTHDVNVEGTRQLAERAVAEGVRRFVLASSCSVYGRGVFDVLDEESPTNPVSAYAESKIEAEKIVLGLMDQGLEPVISRAATVFGWSPRMRFDLAINLMTATAVRQGQVNVLGGGRQWRPFIHVQDMARLFADFLDLPANQVAGEVFNVGSDAINLQIRRLGEIVAGCIPGTKLHLTQDDDDLRSYHVSFKKLHDRLGFECAFGVEQGVREVEDQLRADATIDPFAEDYYNVRRMKHLLEVPTEEGGEPFAPRFIPLAKPVLGEEEERAALHAIRSGWVTSGPAIPAFEKGLATTVGARDVVTAHSCTAAIHLCLAQLGIQPGDEVITSPLTWPSVGNVILSMGAKVVLADIDGGTLNVTPASVETKITGRTRAIIPVHMAGQACDLDGIYSLANKRGIPVIEDAAHAIGAQYKGRPVGSLGPFTCFSFYAIKNLTTFEGGAIAVQDPDVAARLRRLAHHGMAATAWDRYSPTAVPSPPEVIEPGYKYSLGNVNAGVGIEQLKKLPEFLARRRRLARLYLRALADVDEVRLPTVNNHDEHAWHLFIVRFRRDKLAKSRNEIAHALRQENIGVGFHFYGMHLHAYYRDTLGFRPEDLPEATAASHEVLSLPLYPGMTDQNVNEVVGALKKVLRYAHR
jgi:dTDP-4-amino-4,6-dideoxygalactose transaminase/nucleoside-diphosphate-sugar epimerase